ncbi:putative ferric-chelate reductase (NADH) [Rosa chinensis]|uniref:Putative ferric-chelate reductase (NADH) n=1 Tax=Rosa chinensis TaxID=74649 RepID=A0A2P6P5L8_ROSCH|nr:ferric reduction oxidase 8, mitochondrial [Rosa chinensis]PRQ17225.1 putative ferric-chelate reductase (NADH) [Rosa chinensis]
MARTTHLAVLKVLMALIFAAWISLWILKPTQLWTRKWKAAEDLARPTLFGYYGLNFAVYTFPLIALATVGSIYLNMKPREPIRREGRRVIAGFSNPLVVNSLLGILSSIEIVAVLLFMLFLAWTFYVRIANDFKKLKPDKALKLNLWQLKYLRVATRFGLLAEACLAFLLLPVLRGLSVFRLLGIQFEASVRYHIWLGTTMLFCATFHGVSTLFIWGVSHYIQDEVWKWQNTGRIYLAGEISLVTGLVIWITALPQIRRKKFEIFYYTHHLYMVFLVLFLFHAGDRHFYTVFPGIFLFGLDKLLRIIQSRPQTCILSARVFPSKAIELMLPKDPGLKYTPTSVLFLKVPSISKYQWHSFSIISSSSVDANSMSILIKSEGSWTSSLSNLIQTEQKSDADHMKCIPVAVEGPYGPATMEFLRYDSLLLVAGGIGITPFLSVLQELVAAQNSGRYKFLPRMQLIFAVKKAQDICLLNSISPLIFNQPAEKCHLKVKVYVTQEEQSGVTVREVLLNESSRVQTINFGIKSSIYPVTGLESPLWMAAIAGISFILFLIFLIIFNHIFIPSQKNATKEKAPSSVADLLIICSFITVLMCIIFVAFIIRRRRLKRQSPPVFPKKGKALEISPTEARDALEEHEIHFGGRPNFEDIFAKFPNETGGSDVGVLVCGPEAIKESVASICQHKCGGLKVGANNKQNANFSFHSLNFAL